MSRRRHPWEPGVARLAPTAAAGRRGPAPALALALSLSLVPAAGAGSSQPAEGRVVARAAGKAVGAPARVQARTAPGASSAVRAPATVPGPRPSPEEWWRRARQLADQGRPDEALAVVGEGLRDHPGEPGLLWLEAGLHGEAGRHREAVTRYETLMARHPRMARDLRRDLAAQRLWAGDAAGALRDLDLAREESPPEDREARRLRAVALARLDRHAEALAGLERLLAEDPDDVSAALDRARVLAWMGRHAQARAAYETHLRRHPEAADARIGLAQTVNWSGEHRRAAALFEALRGGGNGDPEIARGLAYAEYWAGRPDRAQAALQGLLAARPEDPEGLGLARRLARERGPHLTLAFERSDDTDALRIETTAIELEHPLGDRTSLALLGRRDRARDAVGVREPRQLAAGIERRLSGAWTGRLRIGLLQPVPGDGALGVGEASLVARPDDRWRLDVGWSREPVLTRQALDLRLMVGTLATGVDWQAGRRVTLHGDQRLRFYGDDNASALHAAAVRAIVRSGRAAELGIRLGVDHLTSRRDLDHGYYDPERYLEAGVGADLALRSPGDRALRLEGRVGRLGERGAERQSFYGLAAGADLPLGRVMLHAEGGRTNSNLGSVSGYRQNRWAAWLAAGF